MHKPRKFCFYSFSASVSFDVETRIMSTCMSTSRSNYFDMSIWKKHANHSTSVYILCDTALCSTISVFILKDMPRCIASHLFYLHHSWLRSCERASYSSAYGVKAMLLHPLIYTLYFFIIVSKFLHDCNLF